MEWQGSLLPLFWLFLSIFLVQVIITRISWVRIPSILAYILLGMFIANNDMGGFQSEEVDWLQGLSQLGLFYLMFLSGMEINLHLLWFRKGAKFLENPLIMGLLIFIGSAGLSFLLGLRIQHMDPSIHPWMVMLILSTTSLGIVMPVLKEQGLLNSHYGQTLLTSAFIAELITMTILSVVAGAYQTGFTLRQASVGLLLPLLIICYQGISRIRNTSMWNKQFQKNSVVKLQAILAILGLYGVLTDLTGSEPILGSFLAGLLITSFRFHENNQMKQQLEVIGYGFIIPIFFVMVGAHFKVAEFIESPKALGWVPLLVCTAYIVKVLPMLWIGRSLGIRRALAGGFLLSSRMTLVVVAASIGIRLGVITTDLQDAVLVVAMITSILSPMIFTISHKDAKLN